VKISAGSVAVVGLLAAIAVSAALWVVIFPTPRFPAPTGPYGVGTRVYSWTDPTRPEPFTPDPGDHRELVVQIWYPTTGQGSPQPYMDSSEPIRVLATHLHVPAFLLRNVEHAPTHALRDAPATAGRFPVLINPAGLLVFRDASLFWIEELASQGYIVVGLDQPGTSAATALPGGRVIRAIDKQVFDRYMPMALSQASNPSPILNGVALPGGVIPFLADDLRFVLSQVEILDHDDPFLAGHMDTGRAGVFGMSLGGYVAPEACYRDPRFRACVAVDAGKTAAVAREGLMQPLMIIGRDADVIRAERSKAGGWPEPEITHTINTQRALFEHNRADAYYVTMNGMYHVNWTDAPLWSPIVRWIGLAGPIDPYRGFAETNAYTLAFFDRHLKGKPAPLLDEMPGRQPDARLEVRRVSPGN
jgi:predicted dienelactone hydrolase